MIAFAFFYKLFIISSEFQLAVQVDWVSLWRYWRRGEWTFCVCNKLGGGAIAGSLVL